MILNLNFGILIIFVSKGLQEFKAQEFCGEFSSDFADLLRFLQHWLHPISLCFIFTPEFISRFHFPCFSFFFPGILRRKTQKEHSQKKPKKEAKKK